MCIRDRANTENVPPMNTKVYIVLSSSGKSIESKVTPEVEANIQKAIEKRMKEIEERIKESKKKSDDVMKPAKEPIKVPAASSNKQIDK